jgi:transposase-like protein
MNISCPNCSSHTVRKKRSIHTGKQKNQSVSCNKQFVENPQNKKIPEGTKERIRRS